MVVAAAAIDPGMIAIVTAIVAMIETVGPGDEMMLDIETARARATATGDALEAVRETRTNRIDVTTSTTSTTSMIAGTRMNCESNCIKQLSTEPRMLKRFARTQTGLRVDD